MLPSVLNNDICEYMAALALLILLLKRLSAIDLELRAHRERQRARFYEARAKAHEAAGNAPSDWHTDSRSVG
jgi:hypothetical protein